DKVRHEHEAGGGHHRDLRAEAVEVLQHLVLPARSCAHCRPPHQPSTLTMLMMPVSSTLVTSDGRMPTATITTTSAPIGTRSHQLFASGRCAQRSLFGPKKTRSIIHVM